MTFSAILYDIHHMTHKRRCARIIMRLRASASQPAQMAQRNCTSGTRVQIPPRVTNRDADRKTGEWRK